MARRRMSGGPVRWLRVDAESLHRLGVVVQILALVQIQGARELFDIDHIGYVRLRKAQDRKGSARGGVPARRERDDLHDNIGQSGDVDQRLQLPAHDLETAHRPSESGLVHDRP